jgi:hypothetical protein
MNKWIDAHKKKYSIVTYDLGTALEIGQEEAIPVSALEELFSKEGEQLAMEMMKIKYKGYSHAKFEESLEMESYQQGFIDSHNIQEVKMQALKKDVEEITATCKKWYDAAMYFQDMGKIGINMEDPNMRKIPDAGEFDPNRLGVY